MKSIYNKRKAKVIVDNLGEKLLQKFNLAAFMKPTVDEDAKSDEGT